MNLKYKTHNNRVHQYSPHSSQYLVDTPFAAITALSLCGYSCMQNLAHPLSNIHVLLILEVKRSKYNPCSRGKVWAPFHVKVSEHNINLISICNEFVKQVRSCPWYDQL